MTHKMNFKKFNLDNIQENATICIVAKRGKGKSYLTVDLINHLRKKIDAGIVISRTERMNEFYGKFFPPAFIYDDFNTRIITKLLTRQEKIIDKAREKAKQNKRINPRVLIIMDDCMDRKQNLKNDENIKTIFTNGRHCKIVFILILQDPMGIPPEFRTNIDYAFFFSDDLHCNQKKIFEYYGGSLGHLDFFKKVFNSLTCEKYCCMVIDNKTTSPAIYEKVFWYKSNITHAKKFGSHKFIKFNDVNYDKNWKKKQLHVDINKLKKGNIVIEKNNDENNDEN